MNRRVRFFSKDMGQVGWTRWFVESEDLSAIRGMDISLMESVEEMSREQAAQYLKNMSHDIKIGVKQNEDRT